ncbi:InlB B-repeat-containing protein [Enterococcus sp. CSURQ0835]|uniref:InlB B-repeat-containing protein n=1 Tax=Enterococcus sp. CSURQ0835 TaxID=2681394 RepID=UPI00135BCF35|nr:InlB B-repeat-containing protein [Enterococcus sp. CSURQ0835]
MRKGKQIALTTGMFGLLLFGTVQLFNWSEGATSQVEATATSDTWQDEGGYQIKGDPSGYEAEIYSVKIKKGGNYAIRQQVSNGPTVDVNTDNGAVDLTLNMYTIMRGSETPLVTSGKAPSTITMERDSDIYGNKAGIQGENLTLKGDDPLLTQGGEYDDIVANPTAGLKGNNVAIARGPNGVMTAQGSASGLAGTITINSGNIAASSFGNGAGFMGGYPYQDVPQSKLTINGGKVQLGADSDAAGVTLLNMSGKQPSSFEINGGQVTCTGTAAGLVTVGNASDAATVNGGTLTLVDGPRYQEAVETFGGEKPSLQINGGSVKLDPTHYNLLPTNHSFGTLDGTNITLPTTVQLPGQKAFELTDHHPDDNNFYFYLENGADRVAKIGTGDAEQHYLFKWDAANQKFEPGVLIPKPVFDTTDLPATVVGDAYNQTITAKNADSYELDGKLPTGMNFDSKTGVLSGTPTQAGTFDFKIIAHNAGWDLTAGYVLEVKDKYTVTFDPAGGGKIFSETVVEGDSLKKPADPKRADYTFLGWFPEKDLNHSYDFTKPVTENMTLHAGWRHNEAPIEHETITFDSNGGSSVAPLTVRKGEQLQKPTDPTKKGYTFDGWYTDAALTKAYDFSQPIETNFTLYAKWKSETPEDAGQEPLYRLYNPNSGEHFYTKSAKERDWLISLSWKDEGTAWITPKKGTPVYRVYNPNSGEHFYTKDAAERDDVVKAGWRDEGIGFYSDETNKAVPIYRVFNPNAKNTSSHLFTKSQAEVNGLTTKGWLDENIAFYGVEPAGAE